MYIPWGRVSCFIVWFALFTPQKSVLTRPGYRAEEWNYLVRPGRFTTPIPAVKRLLGRLHIFSSWPLAGLLEERVGLWVRLDGVLEPRHVGVVLRTNVLRQSLDRSSCVHLRKGSSEQDRTEKPIPRDEANPERRRSTPQNSLWDRLLTHKSEKNRVGTMSVPQQRRYFVPKITPQV